jgi:cell wall-associated NlpC family hydrolase
MGAMTIAIPAASASTNSAVVSARSFPAQKRVNARDAFAESTSVDVSGDSDWGGVESLKVKKTDSSAQKAAKKRAAEAARQAAASRSATRTSISSSSSSAASSSSLNITVPSSKNGASIASYGEQFVGKVPYVYGGSTTSGWDCSGFVAYVYAKFGVSLPHYSGGQATAGTAVPSLAQAEPGDIIANSMHAGIYIGNGMVVNALNKSAGTTNSSVSVAFSGSYSIRRIL